MRPRVLLSGLRFPEGPRWHDGKLWISDMHDGRVLTLEDDGHDATILRLDDEPSGLGWLPDGRLLVVSMHERKLLHPSRFVPPVAFRCTDHARRHIQRP